MWLRKKKGEEAASEEVKQVKQSAGESRRALLECKSRRFILKCSPVPQGKEGEQSDLSFGETKPASNLAAENQHAPKDDVKECRKEGGDTPRLDHMVRSPR